MNHIQEDERRRVFSVWLRTGRLPSARNADGIEVKFNPWHDPENGRFAFAGTGRYYGRGGGNSSERRGQNTPEIHYAEDPALPPISSMAEADVWRAEELAKHGHKPGYRKAIEAQYQRYKDAFSGRLKAPPEQNRNTRQPSSTSDPRSSPRPSPDQRSSQRSSRPSPQSPPTRQNVRFMPSDFGLPNDIGGGGGDFGGGGASGSWEEPATPAARRRMETSSVVNIASVPTRSAPWFPRTQRHPPSDSERWRKVERNGYLYEIDDQNRTRRVSGEITTNPGQSRSRTAQSAAGGSDRRASDHGGHYIARRFNGPTEAFNHFAQDANFNRSDYRRLEDEWAREKRAGNNVSVKIVPVFKGSSQRPSVINVWFWVNGEPKSRKLPNEPKGAKGAKR